MVTNQLTPAAACGIIVLRDDKSQLDKEGIIMIKKAIMEITSDAANFIGTAVKDLAHKIKSDEKVNWWVTYLARWLVLILALTVWSVAMMRVGQKKALETYKGWVEEAAMVQRLEIDRNGGGAETAVAEAEALARVLYGVKDNSTDDMRTLCWCVFNRVDNPAFLNDLEAVIGQPQQWMRYSEDNPVLESLYQIAREEIDRWHSGAHRPCSYEYVFMNWTPSDICLRDAWAEGSKTHYWRWGQN